MVDAPIRKVKLAECRAIMETRPDGTLIVSNALPIDEFPPRLTDWLDHWARVAPERTWLAQRDSSGAWRHISYAEGRARVRRIAAALLTRGLSPERPVVILSGNGLSHALLGVAAMYAGIPYAPVSPAYSTISTDFAKLRGIVELLTPGLFFASDAKPFERAIRAVMPADAELVVETNAPQGIAATSFSSLEESADDSLVDLARDRVDPDTIAKFLFTSGSTGVPKAVINTQRMLTANCAQMGAHFAYLKDEPPVTLDWAPWNHTAGGNHDFNLILSLGGTLYIDDGKPTPGAIGTTVKNLKEISPNWYFNVPKGYDALLPYLREDRALCENFFKNLKLLWYAGAGMARHVWEGLDDVAIRTCGERITILTGLGATETAPFAIGANQTMVDAGLVGLPGRGCVLKLVPTDGKFEARVKGPHVTPGYWRAPALTAAAFDEEGYYKFGDALRFADPNDVNRGFYFDGRIAEDFKLSTGTWVAVGPLRAAIIDHCAPYIQDVVIAGLDREFIAVLIFLDVENCRRLAGIPSANLAELSADPKVRAHFQMLLSNFARNATGSATRVERAVLITEGPSIDSAELTDKGSVNQRAVLKNRATLVESLYASTPGPDIIRAI